MAGGGLCVGFVRRPSCLYQYLALRVLAAADGADLVVGELRLPAEQWFDGRIDRAEQRVHGAVAGAFRVERLATDRERDAPRRAAAVRRRDAPSFEVDQRVRVRGCAGGAARCGLLFDERDEVGVRD